MASLAGHIELVVVGNKTMSLKIDGTEFPWYLSTEGVSTTVTGDRSPSITITIPAQSLSIDQRFSNDD